MTLGELIATARELKGWSLRELGSKCGVHNAVISQIETGKIAEPSFVKVVAICRALGVSIERAAKCDVTSSPCRPGR